MTTTPKLVNQAQKNLFLVVTLAAIGGLLLQRHHITARIDKIRNAIMKQDVGDE